VCVYSIHAPLHTIVTNGVRSVERESSSADERTFFQSPVYFLLYYFILFSSSKRVKLKNENHATDLIFMRRKPAR